MKIPKPNDPEAVYRREGHTLQRTLLGIFQV
jgi:hypothetical protein